MSREDDRKWNLPPDVQDANYSPAWETETQVLQDDQAGSPALDQDVDRDAVKTLPGTGDPDDQGEVEVAEGEINMPRLPADADSARPPQ